MKRLQTILAALLFTSTVALAWEPSNRFSMNFAVGGYPEFQRGYYSPTNYDYQSKLISRLYKDYRGAIMTTGTISGEFNWNIGRWFNAAGTLGLCPLWNKTYDGMSGEAKGSRFGMCISIMPKAKLMWCNTPMVRVYTSLALGVNLLPGFDYSNFVIGAGQLNFVGMEIGRKWFGSFEIGAGSLFVGAQAGFGFKF